ncbi:hypothetical protein BU26DRAFT_535396 [Trematosphaeria pertusa]|uniref:SnoaL-like domain-containing protein n=1 Tax=Trematosphaeria pertusa TaxID=390896 RepID=A0A6A6HTK7_9PLEO|nr:uncharacterized protein BU26DRAFT_535396 [Trematosphaeria pertusa]KAF2241112.1 hypothetical protein BU26DRAFT_535396 [Trematosphaeria pertusa]
MRLATLLPLLLAPLGALAAPAATPIDLAVRYSLDSRQARPPKPEPCERMTPAPNATETKARFDKFANAFIYTKNITEAFSYITKEYINHNPAAQNGFDSAWNILSPIWGSQNITPLRTTFNGTSNMGWLNYRSGSFGEVVDRYRWEGGCIAEHWDQGEKYPTST